MGMGQLKDAVFGGDGAACSSGRFGPLRYA